MTDFIKARIKRHECDPTVRQCQETILCQRCWKDWNEKHNIPTEFQVFFFIDRERDTRKDAQKYKSGEPVQCVHCRNYTLRGGYKADPPSCYPAWF